MLQVIFFWKKPNDSLINAIWRSLFMQIKKRAVAAAVIATLGTVGTIESAYAAIADGMYNLVINTTPTQSASWSATQTTTSGTVTVTGVTTSYNFGSSTSWNSSFTFGGVAPNAASQGMNDNASTVASLAGPKGSGIGGDGWSGILGITVSGGGTVFSVNGVPTMSGTLSGTGNNTMTLNVTGRKGAVSSFPMLYDERWNVDNCTFNSSGSCNNNGNSVYKSFSTTSATTVGSGGPATINGKAASAYAADQNGDGKTDYKLTLVSGGQVGSDWGGFFGAGYLEVWNVKLLSTAAGGLHSGFNVDTIYGTAGGDFAQYTSAVPVPAAVWLFGSGLLGLVGIARRKKSA